MLGRAGARATEPDQALVVCLEDIIDVVLGDPGERLRVAKDEHGGHAVLERYVVVGHELSQRCEPLSSGRVGQGC